MMSQSGPSDYIARSCLSSLQNNPVRRRRDRQTSRLRRPTPLLGWQILKEQAGKNICLQCDETEGGGAEEGRETMLSSFELQIAVCSTSSVCQGGTGIRAGVARAPSSPSTLRRIIKRKAKWRACDFGRERIVQVIFFSSFMQYSSFGSVSPHISWRFPYYQSYYNEESRIDPFGGKFSMAKAHRMPQRAKENDLESRRLCFCLL